jgi:hypothetical protein
VSLNRVTHPWEQIEIRSKIALLREEHHDLDVALTAMMEAGTTDQLQRARLKKRKLRLKDEVKQLEDQLIPDIIA